MHRLTIATLAVVDAAIAAAVGIAATLAPLTVLWVLAMGGGADWSALWPASASVWQLGHLVPLRITLPGDYLAATGIDLAAASFVLSLAPLAFAAFTAIFAARSGVRASRADAWATGVVTGSLAFGALTAVIALTAANSVAEADLWQAIALPALVFAVPLLAGAFVAEWREAPAGAVARFRDRVEAAPDGWGDAPGLIVRGAAVVLTGLLGLGALALATALVLRGGEVVALFEAAHVDVLGATVVTLTQLAYLPTLIIWGLAFVAGPGFAVGSATAISPAGTQLGVIPGIPVLGALPESTSPWLLLLALLPIGLGAFAGWIARSRLATADAADDESPAAVDSREDAGSDASRRSSLAGLLAGTDAARDDRDTGDASGARVDPWAGGAPPEHHEPIGARLVIAVGIAVLSGAGAAALALLASGSIGPGRLADVGPEAGALALTVGVEVVIGAGILLLSPRRRGLTPARSDLTSRTDAVTRADAEERSATAFENTAFESTAFENTGSAESSPGDPDSTATADLGTRRPGPLPPID